MKALFLIGAPKSGTSSLHRYLGFHPQVRVSEPKETQFLDLHYEEGVDAFVQRCFPGVTSDQLLVEATSYTFWLPFTAERLERSFPGARVAAVLRHPVERAFSDWWMAVTNSNEDLPFEAALEANLADPRRFTPASWAERTFHRDYLDMGHYAQLLEPFRQRFPLRVVRTEELQADPEGVTRELWRFAGLSDSPAPFDPTPQNTALGQLGGRLNRWADRSGLKARLPEGLARGARALLSRLGDRRPVLDPALRRRLLEHYAPHNRELERMLGLDLAHWSR